MASETLGGGKNEIDRAEGRGVPAVSDIFLLQSVNYIQQGATYFG